MNLSNDGITKASNSCIPEFLAFKTPLDSPLSFGYYMSVRGCENLLIYLWILKDLSWTQNWMIGLVISSFAVCLFGCLTFFSLYHKCFDEAWHFTASFLWLFANTWWMSGELVDWSYPNSHVYDSRKLECSHIMETALTWILFYFVILRPFKVFERIGVSQKDNPSHKKYFYDVGVLPRFPCFSTWRQYEQVHILFWLGKDYAWNTGNVVLWYICSISTLLIALDFIWESAQQEGMGIEFSHYVSTFIWIIANMVWAIGELFYPQRDFPYSIFSAASEAQETPRWYSAWVLIIAMIPLIILFIIWGKATREGNIRSRHLQNDVNEETAGKDSTASNPMWELTV